MVVGRPEPATRTDEGRLGNVGEWCGDTTVVDQGEKSRMIPRNQGQSAHKIVYWRDQNIDMRQERLDVGYTG